MGLITHHRGRLVVHDIGIVGAENWIQCQMGLSPIIIVRGDMKIMHIDGGDGDGGAEKG